MKTDKFVSNAFVITVLGWLLLGVGLFVGLSLLFKDALSVITVTAAALICSALAVFFAVRAKKSFSRTKGWFIIQIASVAVLILILLLSVVPIDYAVNYAINYNTLKSAARQDVTAVKNTYISYQTQENERLTNTVNGLQNYVNSRSEYADNNFTQYLRNTLGQRTNTLNSTSINSFRNGKSDQIRDIRIEMRNYRAGVENGIRRYDSLAVSQNPEALSEIHRHLPEFATQMCERLTAVSASLDLPTISTTGSERYTAANNTPYTYSVEVHSLEDEWGKITRFTWQGAVGAVLISFLVLFIYIFTYPPMQGGAKKGAKRSDAYGLPL